MNTGTQPAREAANMVDLDSNPTKLIEIVEIGKQLLMTRGALTTFSIANDVAKYFAIIPAAFASTYPDLGVLNIMRLATPKRHSVGSYLQCPDHNHVDPVGVTRRTVSGKACRPTFAPQPVYLRPGGIGRPVYRDQADRYAPSWIELYLGDGYGSNKFSLQASNFPHGHGPSGQVLDLNIQVIR